jgi:hypothetical protein
LFGGFLRDAYELSLSSGFFLLLLDDLNFVFLGSLFGHFRGLVINDFSLY